MEPQLVEHNVLKNLLKNSFNEIDIPFTTVVGKYSSNLIKDNWFYFLIIILIIVLIVFRFTQKDKFKEIKEENIIDSSPKKTYEKYLNTSDYYSNTPRI